MCVFFFNKCRVSLAEIHFRDSSVISGFLVISSTESVHKQLSVHVCDTRKESKRIEMGFN